MRIRQVEVYPLEIPYKASFHIARGTVGGGNIKRTVVLVKLIDEEGRYGWGEGSPSHLWSSETMESVVTTLRNYYIPAIIGHSIYDIAGMHRKLDAAVGPSFSMGHPIAKCALDTALHDLLGKSLGLSIGQMWGREKSREAELSWTVSTKDLKEAEQLIEDGMNKGYSHVNIKLGNTETFDRTLCSLARRKLPDGFLWGDANGGYTFTEALRIVPALVGEGLDLLEQPIPSNQLCNWRELKSRLTIPLAVDEPIVSQRDLMEWIRQDLVTGFVAKVTRNGGLFPSRICTEIAEATPLNIICSGLTETGVGLAANLHLACAFGITTPCAWNGPQFLQDDILTEPLSIHQGTISLPDGPGLGIDVDMSKLQFYASAK